VEISISKGTVYATKLVSLEQKVSTMKWEEYGGVHGVP
jgi:hypothetical protein